MSPTSGGSRRRLVWAAAVLLALALGAAAVLVLSDQPDEVSNPDVAFESVPETTPPAATPKPAKEGKDPFDDGFRWPTYGYDKARTKYFPMAQPLRPPFVEKWRMTGSILLEFPPALCGRQLFLLKNNAALYGISRKTGKVRWKRKMGYLAASSPTCEDGTVYVTILQRGKTVRPGRIAAVNANDGRTKWSKKLPSRSESSPLLDKGRLYFGTEDGTVYNMRARDGAVRWTYKAPGAVKGALALADGKLFFGDYAGRVTAIRQSDGRQVWQSSGAGRGLGRSAGNFYATPAVAFGRVYIGNTDGFVYSFSARNGELAWRTKTGGYVYSSPAISPVRGGMVYAGSYDGKLYAFDARSGDVRWTRDSGARISGGIQVIGDLVFYSNLGRKSTGAVGAANGKPVWSIGRGAFNPVIADTRRLYLVGYSSLYMFTEKGRRSDGTLTRAERDRRASRARARAVARRVARRRAEVRDILRKRRRGIEVCFRSGGREVCRLPRPPVCFETEGGRTTCRARKPRVCFEDAGGRKVCRAKRDG